MRDYRNKHNKNKRIKKKFLNIISIELFFLLFAMVVTAVVVLNRDKKNIEKNKQKISKEVSNNIKEKKEKKKEDKEKEEDEEDEKYESKKDNEKYTKDKEEEYNKEKKLRLISSYTTKLETKEQKEKNRVHNIKVAASCINNLEIKPYEIFSFHKTTWLNGSKNKYKEAATIGMKGMDKGLGGGMCQVCSTLFIAALKAGLKIKERHSHSIPVPYAIYGLDASYLTNVKDFKFYNNKNFPILIKSYLKENSLTVEIYGICKEGNEKIKKYIDEWEDCKTIIHPAKTIKKTSNNKKVSVLVEWKLNNKIIDSKKFESIYKLIS